MYGSLELAKTHLEDSGLILPANPNRKFIHGTFNPQNNYIVISDPRNVQTDSNSGKGQSKASTQASLSSIPGPQ